MIFNGDEVIYYKLVESNKFIKFYGNVKVYGLGYILELTFRTSDQCFILEKTFSTWYKVSLMKLLLYGIKIGRR